MAYAPAQLAFGVKMVAPVLMRVMAARNSNSAFSATHPGGGRLVVSGIISEPGSGSDLGVVEDEGRCATAMTHVLNGQKVWNTLGQSADWIFCLVRTDSTAKLQKGISPADRHEDAGHSVRPTPA